MNVRHSPVKGVPQKISVGGSSSSQPDLSKIALDSFEPDLRNAGKRKRKTPENEFAHQFGEFKNEILGVLRESSQIQNDKINTIIDNTTSIVEQLHSIKTTTDYLITENNNCKSEIKTLKDVIKSNEEEIAELKNEVKQLKLKVEAPSVSQLPNYNSESLLVECQERAERSKNLVVTGIPEENLTSLLARQDADKTKLSKITRTIYPNCPEPIKVFRLGKYDSKKTRPLKLCFSSQDTVKTILRNKDIVKVDGVRIYSDQTPQQQKFISNLRNELKKRQVSGEENLKIKYVKGIPKIVNQEEPKN